jgi:transketolase
MPKELCVSIAGLFPWLKGGHLGLSTYTPAVRMGALQHVQVIHAATHGPIGMG